jgi:biopolymer transport protein ExbD
VKITISDAGDQGLNMTPMIDIVFQLILFFLFNLRFKTLDWRIETSLPKGVGPNDDSSIAPILPHVKASLTRLDVEDPTRSRTKLKIAGREWVLPDLVTTADEDREAVFRDVEKHLAALRGLGLPAEIDTPKPTGVTVPHGDVIRVLDAFLTAKFEQVDLQGARDPLPRHAP